VNRDTQDSQETQEPPPRRPCERVTTIQQAVNLSLPSTRLRPDAALFTFARALKAFQKTTRANLAQNELRTHFNQWYQIALPHLPPQADPDEYWFTFLESWAKARHPLGANILDHAWKTAQADPDPPEARRFTSPKLKLLISLCCRLQLKSGPGAFFLSVRDVQRLLQVESLSTASAWLNGLCRERILTVVSKGGPANRQASRFRFNFASDNASTPPPSETQPEA